MAERMGLYAASEGITGVGRSDLGLEIGKEAASINADELGLDNKNLRRLANKSLQDTARALYSAASVTAEIRPGDSSFGGDTMGARGFSLSSSREIDRPSMSVSKMADALNHPAWGSALREYIAKGGPRNTSITEENNEFLRALSKGDPLAKEMRMALDKADKNGKFGQVQEAAAKTDLVAKADVQEHMRKRIAASAETELGRLDKANVGDVDARLFSKYQSLLKRMKSGTAQGQKDAYREAQSLAKEFSTEELSRLRQATGGGGLASQLTGMSLIEELGGPMTRKQYNAFQQKMKAAGMGGLMEMLDPDKKKQVENMLKNDGKIDATEAGQLKDIMKEVAESIRSFTEAGREDALTKMTNTFNTYMNTNMIFQNAIATYIVKREGIDKDSLVTAVVEGIKQEQGGATPPGTEQGGAGEKKSQ